MKEHPANERDVFFALPAPVFVRCPFQYQYVISAVLSNNL